MARARSIWRCNECGTVSPRWIGRCNDCGNFGTMIEEIDESTVSSSKTTKGGGLRAIKPSSHHASSAPVKLTEASVFAGERLSTHISEFDRVLGGGLIKGSLTLLSGEPGIGKSTLLLQTAGALANNDKKVLYACGEESTSQVATRAHRLGLKGANIDLLPEVLAESIIATALKERPDLLIIDSIQTCYTEELSGAPGSTGQVRACAGAFMRMAKEEGISTLLVGHVTKDGSVAGPRVLEHMVDTVLNFEGDKDHQFRIIRSSKNRFGTTSEIGIFEMEEQGLVPVTSPSDLLIEQRGEAVSGSVFFVDCEATRPLVVEVQALVTPSYLPSPRRLATGVESLRLLQVIAVLERRAGLSFSNLDVIVSIAGGIKVSEPAIDLALALALISAHKDIALDPQSAAFGEIALTGTVRPAKRRDARIKEAENLGIKRVLTSNELATVADCLKLFSVE